MTGPAPSAPRPRLSRRQVWLIVLTAVLAVALAGAGSATVLLWLRTQPVAAPGTGPQAGDCYLRASDWPGEFNGTADRDERVPCEQEHTLETIATGLIEGERPTPLMDSGPELYQECEQAARRFLGAPWRDTHTWLVLSVPGGDDFDAGARWYRCDLAPNPYLWKGPTPTVAGSLQDTDLLITCVDWPAGKELEDYIDAEDLANAVACEQPHKVEFAGSFRLPDDVSYWSDNEEYNRVANHECEGFWTPFVGTSPWPDDLDFWAYHFAEPGDLDRNVLCLVVAPHGKLLVGSVKGLGRGEVTLVDS
jgi:hypothetical protein